MFHGACQLVERRAKFKHPLPRAFHRQGEAQPRGRIEKQNYAVELALTGGARECQTNWVKHGAAPIRHRRFHALDDFLEAGGINFFAFENAIRQLANHFPRTSAREYRLAFRLPQKRARVVMENPPEQSSQRRAVLRMRPEQFRCACEPSEKCVAGARFLSGIEPTLFAQNCRNIHSREWIRCCVCGFGGRIGWHREQFYRSWTKGNGIVSLRALQ
jgi:hypothetical protein